VSEAVAHVTIEWLLTEERSSRRHESGAAPTSWLGHRAPWSRRRAPVWGGRVRRADRGMSAVHQQPHRPDALGLRVSPRCDGGMRESATPAVRDIARTHRRGCSRRRQPTPTDARRLRRTRQRARSMSCSLSIPISAGSKRRESLAGAFCVGYLRTRRCHPNPLRRHRSRLLLWRSRRRRDYL